MLRRADEQEQEDYPRLSIFGRWTEFFGCRFGQRSGLLNVAVRLQPTELPATTSGCVAWRRSKRDFAYTRRLDLE
jgi:hypothetical protein